MTNDNLGMGRVELECASARRRESDARWLAYVTDKVGLARRLASGELGGDYNDAVVLLAVQISGMAADLWPGKGIDRARFVEVVVRRAAPELQPARISTPLLLQALQRDGQMVECRAIARRLPNAFGSGFASRVIQGSEVDLPEAEIQRLCPALPLGRLRRYSYADSLYRKFRSALVHEAHLGDSADRWAHSSATELVSYTNVLERHSHRAARRLHFDVEWVARATLSIATASAADIGVPQPVPGKWWVNGG